MQTFLPYPDFDASAQALDTRRLGKQRVEVIQIVRALTVPSYSWKSHPAVLMWEGHEEALGAYGLAMTREWHERGFADTCAATITADLAAAGVAPIRGQADLAARGALPPWLGDGALHRSHQSALVRKDPVYHDRFPDVPADLPYVWPVRAQSALDAERRRAEAAARRAERGAARADARRTPPAAPRSASPPRAP
jgi:hypothetical protein